MRTITAAGALSENLNLDKVAGANVTVGAGNATSNTPRVVIASDQPDLPVNLTKTGGTALATGAGNATAGTPRVVIVSDQANLPVVSADGGVVALGATGDAAATTDTGTFTLLSLFKRLLGKVTTLLGQLPSALTAGGNLKVSLAESTATQAVSGTVSVSSLPNTTVAGQTAKTFDFDTGAGTDTLQVIGLALPKSGGAAVGGTATDPFRIDPTGTTSQPVTGTVTANIGTAGTLALDATLTGGGQKAVMRGGAKGSTTAADATSTVSGANHQAVDTVLYDASGNLLGVSGAPMRVDPTGTTTQPVSSVDGGVVALGAKADAEASTDTGTFSLIALFKHLLTKTTTLLGQLPGALTSAGNLKVALLETTDTTNLNASIAMNSALSNAEVSCIGCASVAIQITGSWTGDLRFEATTDNTNWSIIEAGKYNDTSSVFYATGINNNGIFQVACGALLKVRVKVNIMGTGTATVSLRASPAAPAFIMPVFSDGRIDVDLNRFNGTTVSTNSGVAGAGTQRVILATDQPPVTVNTELATAKGTALASAARTASTSSATLSNNDASCVIVYLNVTAASGTGGLTVRITSPDPISGSLLFFNAAPTPIAAVGLYGYVMGPGCTATALVGAAGVQQFTPAPLPPDFVIRVTVGDGSSYTYSVSYALVK